jgi:hypothetical protein
MEFCIGVGSGVGRGVGSGVGSSVGSGVGIWPLLSHRSYSILGRNPQKEKCSVH